MSIEEALSLLDELWTYFYGFMMMAHCTRLSYFYNLNTQAYSEEVNRELFVPKLKEFGIDAKPTIERKKDGREFWYLRIGKYDGAYEISELLKKYYVSCYDYKIWSSETIQIWSKMQEHLKSNDILNCSTRKKQ